MAPPPINKGLVSSVTDQDERYLAVSISTSETLFGRERELERIQQHFMQVPDGRGSFVCIVGESGSGKTHLAREVARRVQAFGKHAHWVRCQQHDWRPRYQLWSSLIDQLLESGNFENMEAPLWVGPLIPVVPGLARAFPHIPPLGVLPLEDEHLRIADALQACIHDLTSIQPCLAVLDDLQWADADSLKVLALLAPAIASMPLQLVATVRDDDLSDNRLLGEVFRQRRRELGWLEVHLGGLSESAVSQLMARISGETVPGSVVQAVNRLTLGNPFFVGEVTRHHLELHGQNAGQNSWLAPGQPDLDLPESLHHVVESRVAQLSADAQRLIRLAAVSTDGFDMQTLHCLSGLPEEQILNALDEALKARLITPLSETDETYDFQHQLVRTALYRAWSPSRRIRLHRSLAEAIQNRAHSLATMPVERIATHYHVSRSVEGAEAGVPFAQIAAERAHQRRAPEEELAWLKIASDLAVELPAKARAKIATALLLSEVAALHVQTATQRISETLAVLEEARYSAGDRSRFLAEVVTALHDAGAPSELWTPRLHEALDMVEPGDDLTWTRLTLLIEPFETVAVEGIAGSHWLGNDPRASAIARASGDEGLFARSLQPWDLWDRSWTLEITNLVATWQQPAAILRALTISGAGWLYLHGEFRLARSHFEKLLTVARQQASVQGQGEALVRLSVTAAALGDVTAARNHEREASAFVGRLGKGHNLHASLWWARAYLCELEGLPYDGVADFFRDYIGNPDVARRTIAFDDAALATLALVRIGQVSAATHLLQPLVQLLDQLDPTTWLMNGAVAFAGATIWELKLPGPASVVLRATIAAMKAGHSDYPGCSNHLTVARMLVVLGRPDIARRWFTLARENLDQSGQRAVRAQVDLDQAITLAAGSEDNWAMALDLAQRARVQFAGLQIAVAATRADQLVQELTLRITPKDVPAGLTAREMMVLRLVAQGISDREIGEAIFVSPRTVNAHVRNILSKTGARNRTELSLWAVRNGMATSGVES